MKTIAIIPARANSKRIKDKNIKDFAGKPLLFWSIDIAIASNKIDEIYVSTENIQIKELVKTNYRLSEDIYGKPISIIDRPDTLSQDNSSVIDVLRHAINYLDYEECLIVLLYPTYPLRTDKLLNDVIDFAIMQGYGNTITVVKGDKKVYWYVDFTCGNKIQKILPNEIYREQDMQQPYKLAGAVHCIFSDDLTDMDQNGMSKHNFGYVIEEEALCLEVDDEEAFIRAEQIKQYRILSTICYYSNNSHYAKCHFNYN
ncbi:hypothetical protein LCGC14_0545720 [marine sediment metagenome]|uniref:CMP-N-acetylneuraminic acid synthetase n=1 Tax=marine sediment metagenome TaxID=412755 RepID=A0A0F9S9X4_9ZZZZ